MILERPIRINHANFEIMLACPGGPDYPCQDACSAYQGFAHGAPFVVTAVADGHGSPIHENSAIGAKLAADIATQCLSELARAIIETKHAEMPFNLERHLEEKLPANMLRRWREEVVADKTRVLRDNDDQEIRGKSDEAKILSFGSTLVAALTVESCITIVSIGDSACFFLKGNEGSEKCYEVCADTSIRALNETDSLCSVDAKYRFRSEVIDCKNDEDFMLCLCSDGLVDAMHREELEKALISIFRGYRKLGAEWLAQKLTPKLREWSDNGSRDDMGITLLLRRSGGVV